MTCALSTFPFLTALEFDHACRVLADRAGGWPSIRLVTQNATSLKITRQVEIHSDSPESEIENESENENENESASANADVQHAQEASALEDDDPEALVRTDCHPKLHIEYDILLSPTYQVPVLYFVLRWDNQGPLGLDAVYRYLVPELYRKELKSVGVMGGISFGYHPESGTPAFFVHPCNTADAMGQIADARSVTPETYLLIWLGLVGQCVSLHVPRELALPQDGARPS